MKTTLAQARAAIDISGAAGIANCDPRYVALVNQAQSYLSELGRWWGTYRRLYVCMTNGCVTWPWPVANVETFKICEFGVTILNLWYEFGDAVMAPTAECGCASDLLIDRPTSPAFTDIDTPSKIRIYPAVATDAGKRVLLQGIDDGTGNPIRTQDGATYVDGEYLTLASPFSTSSFTFRKPGLTGAQKPVTNGLLSVYSVNSAGTEERIAEWGAAERNPDYRRSQLLNYPTATTPCCAGPAGCAVLPSCGGVIGEAIVRLEAVPVAVDSDWLAIGNLKALKHGMLACLKADQNDYVGEEKNKADAIKILRAENEKYSPKRTMRVNAQPEGTAHFDRVAAGFR